MTDINLKLKTNVFSVKALMDMPFIKKGCRYNTALVTTDTGRNVTIITKTRLSRDSHVMTVVFFPPTKDLNWLFEYVPIGTDVDAYIKSFNETAVSYANPETKLKLSI